MQNKPLLEAAKHFLEEKGIVFTNSALKEYKNSIQLIISTTSELQKFVQFFEESGAHDALTDVRKNQYTCFVEALQLYLDPSFRDDFEKCSRFILLKWTMNAGTNYKKKGSYEEDMVKLQRWYNKKNTK
jgi:hypothetical protein